MFTEDDYSYILALLNSKVGEFYLNLINPTINFLVNDIMSIPYIKSGEEEIDALVKENIRLAKEDYDLYETSWNYSCDPLTFKALHSRYENKVDVFIKHIYSEVSTDAEKRFNALKTNEMNLNTRLILLYGPESVKLGC